MEQHKVKTQLKSGAQIVGRELDRIDDRIRILEEESQNIHERFASHVAERLVETEVRQARHESVTTQLHEAVQGTSDLSEHRYQLLDQKILPLIEQNQLEHKQHEKNTNPVKQELQRRLEEQQARDGDILDMREMVQTLMGQVKGNGKASDPTPEALGAGGGKPPPRPRRTAAGAPGGGGDAMTKEKGLDGSQTREGKEHGKRDLHPSQKTNMTPSMTHSLICFLESGQTLWDDVRESQPKPPPRFKNEKHQDIRMWLLICADFFIQNSWQ